MRNINFHSLKYYFLSKNYLKINNIFPIFQSNHCVLFEKIQNKQNKRNFQGILFENASHCNVIPTGVIMYCITFIIR